jgi:ubiquinone/menaquinone biosynthesis C-methylase UbiE
MENERNRVCPVEFAGSLDSTIRRWLQNPQKIVGPYVKAGMVVLDVGCGPGFFSIEMAKMVGPNGKVISADLQQGMIDKLASKIKGTSAEKRIALVKCDKNAINVSETVDFILTFYMVHEVPDKDAFFRQLHDVLKVEGRYLIVEPKLFHVSKAEFLATIQRAEKNGFRANPGPKLPFSWSSVLTTH